MTTHSKSSPSSADRWMLCPGSAALPENAPGQGGSSSYADEGTAAHTLGAECLEDGTNATDHIGRVIEVKDDDGTVRSTWTVDADFADAVQVYIDDVRSRAIGAHLMIEQRVDTSPWLGMEPCPHCLGGAALVSGNCAVCKNTGEVPQGGTSDAIIYDDIFELLTAEDLKFGKGIKVYAASNDETLPPHKRINRQAGIYCLGALEKVELLGNVVEVAAVINQPRIGHLDEFRISLEELMLFGESVKAAQVEIDAAQEAYAKHGLAGDFLLYLNPGPKQCQWCRATVTCPKLRAKIEDDTRSQFADIEDQPPMAPSRMDDLSRAYIAVPLIVAWCKAVAAEVHRLVATGSQVIGRDGKPLKFVEGELGDRKWSDEAAAEALLQGILSEDKMYAPRKIITAAVAKKLLDRKATKATYTDMVEPLISRAKGKPLLVQGSDPRPPYDNSAKATEFEELDHEE